MTWITTSREGNKSGYSLEPDHDKVPLLIGPTGIGKSSVALSTAQKCDGEIISMDSCAVYAGLDIGSAKPSLEDRALVKHHLVDAVKPNERYSAGKFFSDACALVKDIRSRGKQPIIVGGTMLYANVLLNGIAQIPPISSEIRMQAKKIVASDVGAALMELGKYDSRAKSLHPKDKVRIERAWEVLLATGRPLSEWHAESNMLPDFKIDLHVILPASKKKIREALDERFAKMMEAGFLEEVRSLVKQYGSKIYALKSVGYKQLLSHVLGEQSEQEATAAAMGATRRLARGQIAWVKKFEPSRNEIIIV